MNSSIKSYDYEKMFFQRREGLLVEENSQEHSFDEIKYAFRNTSSLFCHKSCCRFQLFSSHHLNF